MRLIIVLACIIFFVPGCSSMNPLSFLAKKPSIEVNANIGKNVNQDKNMIKVETGTTNQTADAISNDTSYTADTVNQITNNLTPLQLLIIVIMSAFAVPSYKEVSVSTRALVLELYSGARFVILDILKLLIYPCTAIADFVLLLLGREKKQSSSITDERRK